MQIFVIGAHRSGTSVVTRVLNLMGIYLGENESLIPPLPENPRGFWERKDVLALDKKIMNELGSNWYRIYDFDLKNLPDSSLLEYQQEIQSIVSELDLSRPWAIKEPRLSLLFPLWKNFLDSPLCIHVARHPIEVAKSLQTRNDFPIATGIALWEYYLCEEVKNIWQLPKISILHHDLISSPIETINKLYNDLIRSGVKSITLPSNEEITSFIDSKLHNEKANCNLENEFLSEKTLNLWNQVKDGGIWKAETPPQCSLQAKEILQVFGSARLTADYNDKYKGAFEKGEILDALKNRLRQFASLQEKLGSNLHTLQKLSNWFESISGAFHHTLNSKHWLVGKKLFPVAKELEGSLDHVAKIVLHYQTWEGREWLNYSSNINKTEFDISNYRVGSVEEIKLSIKIVEEKIENLQRINKKTKLQENQLRTWLHALTNSYQQLQNSRTWKAGTKIVELTKRLKIKNRNPLPWPHEVAFYSRSFYNFESENPAESNSLEVYLDNRKSIEQKIFYDLTASQKPDISLIVLNKDGAEHLDNLFQSFLKHNSLPEIEFIIVDHASKDESLSIIDSYSQKLPIKLISYKTNNSYSYSNNEAAKLSSAPYLLFLNNDIIFTTDVLQELIFAYKENPEVGLVGSKLFFPDKADSHREGLLQHAGIIFEEDHQFSFHRPKNLDGKHRGELFKSHVEKFPAVTAAVLLCEREEFLAKGGFSEDYFYGYEDVDLSLRYLKDNRYSLVPNHISFIHNESATRSKIEGIEKTYRSLNNIAALKNNFAYSIKRAFESDKYEGKEFWTLKKPVVAFAVTEAKVGATAGDYFTAYELADYCRHEFNWQTKFLPARDKNGTWYDLEDVDVLITMVDQYDLRQVVNAKCNLIKIAWLRNWFDRWAEQPWFSDYDLCLCSSEKSAKFIRENYDKDAKVFRIATNSRRFREANANSQLTTDCVFTGSYWKAKREIEDAFSTIENIPNFAIYGHGWEEHPTLSKYHKGFLAYEKLPELYNSAKIVLDDANHVTKSWGSINSRVFDAIASGCLVITNGKEGVKEVFSNLLPSYVDAKDLEKTINYYLVNEKERKSLVKKLKNIVLSEHTYRNRANELREHLIDFTKNKYRIAIKAPVPRIEEAEQWGDYHFAVALKQEFEKLGHSVRIDILPDWQNEYAMADQVVIVLRGLSEYKTDPEHVNLMWNISHPDKVSVEEYNTYDHVFVASSKYAKKLESQLKTSVSSLIQCTNQKYFYRDEDKDILSHDLLFVGNSRKQYRQIIKDCIKSGLNPAVYGSRWEGIIPDNLVRGQNIANKELRKYYSNAKIVLNDHWPSMSKEGFISNRIFDVAATGSLIISDEVGGSEEIFGSKLCTYSDAQDLKEKVDFFLNNEQARLDRARQLQEVVSEKHTFKSRVIEMLSIIDKLDAGRRLDRNQNSLQAETEEDPIDFENNVKESRIANL